MDDFGNCQALSFDCYGTLIDWEAGMLAELEPWARRHGLDAGPEELLAAVAEHETRVQSEQPGLRYPDVLAGVLERIAGDYGVTADGNERQAFGESVARWPAFPDSLDALARLQTRYRLVILSNVDRASFAASNERLGVEFDLVITAEDVGSYKPDPANFRALIDGVTGLGIESGQLLHVAQSLYHDHEPARSAGLESVWIDRRHGRTGSGATPAPTDPSVVPDRRYESLAAFADAALAV